MRFHRLPPNLRAIDNHSAFRRGLKTHLFHLAFWQCNALSAASVWEGTITLYLLLLLLLKYRHPVWYGKTRMVWLPYGEKTSKICLFVLTWSTNVTDRRTDRQTDTACRHRPRLCIASRGKNHPDFNKIWYTRAHFGIDDTWQRYDHIWKFVKFKMADGRHLKNYFWQ